MEAIYVFTHLTMAVCILSISYSLFSLTALKEKLSIKWAKISSFQDSAGNIELNLKNDAFSTIKMFQDTGLGS